MGTVQKMDVSGCKVIQFSLRITELCNRDCSYCHYHSNIDYNKKDIMKIIDQCVSYAKEKNRTPLFYFHGGEPTLSKYLIDYLKYIKYLNSNSIIELQTNFDNPDLIISSLDYIDLLNISFHFEITNNKIITYKDKLKYFKNKKLLIKLNYIDLMVIKNNIKDIIFLRKYFNLLNIRTEITYNYFQSDSFENLVKSKIKLTKQEIEKNKYFAGEITVPDNYLCDTSYYIIINGNGDLFKCSYSLTQNAPTGNILNGDNLKDTMKKSLCEFKTCGYELSYLQDFI